MFQDIQQAPPDPILGLTEAFGKDTNPRKINLSVGVYKDASSATPVLKTVKEAETRILASEKSKGYKPIPGAPEYQLAVQKLMLGNDHALIGSGKVATCHTPGGTGALRVAGDFLNQTQPGATLWLSNPTWANHGAIFAAAGVTTKSYDYFDKTTNALDFDAMLASLNQIPAGDVILLHGCCHNPTGVDPSPEQWQQIGQVLAAKQILPLLDFAYQGFATGIDEDAAGLRALLDTCPELMVCSSFSKNFGLYCERTGAFTVVTPNAETTSKVLSQVKLVIRRNYSNPPAHGGAIVSTILDDAELRTQWEAELAQMRTRINGMRKLFVESLNKRSINLSSTGNDFIVEQNGMFSFSGLNKDQVGTLRDEHSIYIVGSGRINVAGMTETNMDQLCDAIASVM
jgi:aspartate/tyrosine/aromatic aminotransferase